MVKTWIDRVTQPLAPRWTLRRMRARVASELLARNYEAAGSGRRTQNWRRTLSDANAAIGSQGGRLRDVARDLIRNNPYAESAVSTIVDHTVGWGIVAKPSPVNARIKALWEAWADTTACDADGIHNFAGLEKLVMRTVASDGECLIRRRLRRPEDGLPIPLQIQVLEPDYLDTMKENGRLPNGGRIIQGVEFDPLGKRAAYWLFHEHPGSSQMVAMQSVRVPAENIRHVFRVQRPGQVRGVTWFAPVLLRFKDFDEFEDATLMKQKVAACLAVITSDVDGSATALGSVESTDSTIDSLEPGMIMNVPPGRNIDVVQPPTVGEYAEYTKTTLRSMATGLRVTYEDLTGDFGEVNFSSSRMSRLRHYQAVDDWRWNMLIPQFCDPVWAWAMQAAAIANLGVMAGATPTAAWTSPPIPMIEPDKEGLAYQRNIRTGIMSLSEAIRERGYDPSDLLNEIAADNKILDKLGIILDCDPRKMSAAGQMQSVSATPPAQTEEETSRTGRLRMA